ncbi:hypothetical protein BKA69DRAFT_1052917 [Paraphysoderma sedebokerense]|nr:hypothetical protein BKA69DRAFT_1052917 [Paraphysoderma sedebokerense]
MASNTSGTAVIKAATSYKKKPGTLQVMPDALLWTNKIDPNSTVSIKFSSIKAQFMSAATAKKVMLKISASIGSKDEDYTFTFTSNSATEERETVKDIIVNHLSSRKPSSAPATPLSSSGNPSAPATSQSSRPGTTSVVKLNQEFQLRDALLKQHKSLKRLHQELVLGGHVTEEEFWESRKHLIETQALRSGQKPGYSSAQMAGVQPTRSEGTDVKYTLTPQIIHSIFLQYPSIKKAYEDNVPDKISEQEFWRRYFSSQFFHRTRMQSRSTKIEGKDDIFDKCMQMEEDALLPSSKRMKLDAIHKTLNLEATAGDRVEESGNAPDKTMQHEKSSLPIIRRFNRQSEILLKEILKTSRKDPSSIDGQTTAEKEIIIEDLVPSQENKQLPLNIEDQSRYFDTTTSADAVNGALSVRLL